jgi:hypothetical protein
MLVTACPGQRKRGWLDSLNLWDLFRLEEPPLVSRLPRQARKAEERENEARGVGPALRTYLKKW